MNIEKFDTLTLPQKCYYVVQRGVYLATFNDVHLSIDLYQVENYYVEIFYEHGSTDCSMARAFTGTYELNKYLEKISITELLGHF
jgi:hypothetical protein